MALCEPLSAALLKIYNNPPTVDPSTDPIAYGTEVQIKCRVDGGKSSERKRTCLYDVDTHAYKLIGDSLECGSECH